MVEITSRTNEKVKEIAKLANDSGERLKNGVAVLEGKKLVIEAINRGFSFHSLWIEKTVYEEIAISLDNNNITNDNIYITTSHVIEKISSQKNSQGIVGIIHTNQNKGEMNSEKALLISEIQDPLNVGAIIRSAVAFGFKDIYISKCSADPFSQKAIRGSMGAVLRCQVEYNVDAEETIDTLKQRGYKTFATALNENSIKLSDVDPLDETKVLVVIGNEGNGLSDSVLSKCDSVLKIPIVGDIESLNASVAAGIIMYHLGNK